MSPLSLFIIFILGITFLVARYTFKRLKDPIQFPTSENSPQRRHSDFWINAETTNGRLAMMGLLALVINYGLFGWIIPGFF